MKRMANKADIDILSSKPGQDDEKGLDIFLKEENLREQAKDARELINTIQDELDHRSQDLKDGLSFLDMKNDILLSYMIDVCNIVLRKVRGETIGDHRSVERCVEYRVILDKIKAIDQKLAYQLNKLISLPEDAQGEDQRIDVNNLDINLDNLETDAEENDSSEEEDDSEIDDSDGDASQEGSVSGSGLSDRSSNDLDEEIEAVKVDHKQSKSKKPAGIYKPPKLRSVAYTEERDYAKGSRGRRKNYEEFYQDENPDHVVDQVHNNRDDERVRFEEENFIRLPDENPKKAKRKAKTKEYRKKGKKRFKRRT